MHLHLPSTILSLILLTAPAHADVIAHFQLFNTPACTGSATDVQVDRALADQTNDMPGGPWKALSLQSVTSGCQFLLCLTGSACDGSSFLFVNNLGCMAVESNEESYDRFVVICT
jgi:hypothetical protein